MSGASIVSRQARAQYAAFVKIRRRMFVHSLHTMRGSFELGAKIFSTLMYFVLGLSAAFGLGYGAWQAAAYGHPDAFTFLLWPVFVLWQIVPVMAASFTEVIDLGGLLRFPLGFGPYAVLYLVFGLFDLSTLLGGICLAGIWVGTGIARPALLPWAALVLLLFAAFNILLTRMIFAWIDRWLAQRRTREVLSAVFLFLLLGVQFVNPAVRRGLTSGHKRTHAPLVTEQTVAALNRAQSALPAGLAAGALRAAVEGRLPAGLADAGGVMLYAAAAGLLLCVRLRKEYRGESLSEAPAREAVKARSHAGPMPAMLREDGDAEEKASAWGAVQAVFVKEARTLLRSGAMLYSLVAPLVILFVFRGGSAGHSFTYALPVGIAYGFLGLVRMMYNSLGAEGGGIQFYFLSLVPMRSVMLGKNLLHLALAVAETAVMSGLAIYLFGVPDSQIVLATAAWVVFALPAHLAAGNLLSILMPYKMTLWRMSRDQGATGNALLSMALQAAIFGVGALVVLGLTALGHPDLAPVVLLGLAAGSAAAYVLVLKNAGRMMMARREPLVETLARI
ncbi:hypothetical protein [Paracidobacterium acidisoli]|uniref:Uncharacterized protein n=1 Tax=Paracidobacterium acidisoli TaxID=2303751 RepID=A0A372IPS0_9BACT|nr:hypothetical protein [Paracidobacterium acidisoli]MBT9331294.1 hypothetical protein [Paracidobacterium acidisoli]